MPAQRSRDVHIWRLPAKNGVSRMAIYAQLHGNYMFSFHTNSLVVNIKCMNCPRIGHNFFCLFASALALFLASQNAKDVFFYFFILFLKRSGFLFSLLSQPRNSQMKIEYSDVGLQILIFKTSGLQIPMNSWRSTAIIS